MTPEHRREYRVTAVTWTWTGDYKEHPEPSDPEPPEGEGWKLCHFAATPRDGDEGALFFVWVRNRPGEVARVDRCGE